MSFSLNVLKLLSGRMAVQILSFVTVPIAVRLFSPEHFGVIQIFDSFSKFLIVLTCLKYELSIPLARDDNEAVASLVASLFITIMFTCFVTGVIAVARVHIATWLKVPELQVFLWFLPLIVLISGVGNILANWVAYEERFSVIAWADVAQSLPERIIQIAWGALIGASAFGLFVARFAGIGVRIGMLLALLGRKLITVLKTTKLSADTLWTVVTRHKKFPIFTTWAMFLNNISVQLVPLFFGVYFSTTVVGFYSLGFRVISFPMIMLGTSMERVFFPLAAKEYHEHGSLTDIVSKCFTRLVQIGVFPMAIVSVLGPTLFGIIFGQQWAEAGIYAQMIGIWYMIGVISAPLRIFELVNRQESRLLMDIFTMLGRTIGLFIGVTTASPVVTIGIFVTLTVCSFLASLVWQLRLAQVSVLWAFKTLGQYIAISYILLFPVKLLLCLFADNFGILVGTLGGITVVYGIVLCMIDRSARQVFLKIVGKLRTNSRI